MYFVASRLMMNIFKDVHRDTHVLIGVQKLFVDFGEIDCNNVITHNLCCNFVSFETVDISYDFDETKQIKSRNKP